MGFRDRLRGRLHSGQTDDRPDPVPGASNYILLILDSCRYDSLMQANLPILSKFGEVERRYAYATWTAPSHYNLLMGLLPHPSPKNVFASTYYKQDFAHFGRRLGLNSVNFENMVPRMWLPHYLKHEQGYLTRAIVSMPVLNPQTPLAVDFDSFEMAEHHNDLCAIVRQMQFSKERPTFYLINTGETHYPYAPIDEPESQWPRIHGAHGVFKRMSMGQGFSTSEQPQFFNHERLEQLRKRQVRVLQWINKGLTDLFDAVPPNTTITITADHGELFGESDYFGHGPIMHKKVLEVPFIEGRIR